MVSFPSTEYKNGMLFEQVEYVFCGRLAKPDQYVVVVGQNHKHVDEIIACGALAKKPFCILENKLYISGPAFVEAAAKPKGLENLLWKLVKNNKVKRTYNP